VPLLASLRLCLVVATGVCDHATQLVEGHAVHATQQLDRDVVRCYVNRRGKYQHDITQLADAKTFVATLSDTCPDVSAADFGTVCPAGIVPAIADDGNLVVQLAAECNLSIDSQEM